MGTLDENETPLNLYKKLYTFIWAFQHQINHIKQRTGQSTFISKYISQNVKLIRNWEKNENNFLLKEARILQLPFSPVNTLHILYVF